jgi:uncharacterized protein (DUF58 family)
VGEEPAETTRPAGDALLQRRLRLTGEGRMVLLVLAGLLLGALNTGTNLLYFLTGVILNGALLNAWVAARTVRRLEVERAGPEELPAGELGVERWTLKAARGLGPPVGVELAGEGAASAHGPGGFSPRLLAGGLGAGDHAVRLRVGFQRRGRKRFDGLRLTCRAPLGLVECARVAPAPWSVLVLPRARRLRPGALQTLERPAEAAARRWRGYAQERRDVVRSLREHRPGDDRRAVHWRTSARRGELVVKVFERSAPDLGLVLLDLALPEGPGGSAAVEAAVVLAASLCGALEEDGKRVALGVADARGSRLTAPGTGPGPRRRVLRVLAGAEGCPAPDLADLARSAAHVSAEAQVFLVTTRTPPRGACGGAHVLRVGGPEDLSRWLVPAWEETP